MLEEHQSCLSNAPPIKSNNLYNSCKLTFCVLGEYFCGGAIVFGCPVGHTLVRVSGLHGVGVTLGPFWGLLCSC